MTILIIINPIASICYRVTLIERDCYRPTHYYRKPITPGDLT